MIIMTRDGEPVDLATGDNSTLLVGGELAISFCAQGSKLGKKRKETGKQSSEVLLAKLHVVCW